MAIITNSCFTEEMSNRVHAKHPHASHTDARLQTRASSLLATHVNKVELDDELVSIDQYVLIDLAHAVMLTRTGIFDAQHGQNMVKTLLSLRAGDTASMLASKPEVGTLGLQIENYLEHELGPRGRDIQRARSRIDQKATNWRLIDRASLTEVIQGLVALRSQILETAEHYADALMPGYTHLQHSQPTTIDHYLNAHYWAVSQPVSTLRSIRPTEPKSTVTNDNYFGVLASTVCPPLENRQGPNEGSPSDLYKMSPQAGQLSCSAPPS